MRLFDGTSRLFLKRNRSLFSGYPSARTPQLKEAWSTPEVKFTATVQPYAAPLSMYGGNAILNGETYEMRREYRDWSFREPTVKSALLTSCIAVAALDPQLTADNPRDQRDKEVADWVDWSVKSAHGGWGGLIQSMLLPARIDGFSLLEKCWGEVGDELNKIPNSQKYRKFWTCHRFAMMDTEHIRFKLDEYRQVIGVRPMTGLSGYQELPPDTFLIYTHLKMFENPFGISELRAVVRDCRTLVAACELRHLLMSNWAGPFLVGTAQDDGTRQQMWAAMQRARSGGFLVIPEGCTIEVFNLATSAANIFDATIASYRENIVAAIQGSYLQLLEGHTTDGPGNTNVHKGIAELFQWWLAMWVCEVINRQLIPDLVYPNYGKSVGLPRLTLGGIDENMVNAALDRFKRGHDLGFTLSREQVGTVGGFEAPKDEMDKLPPPMQTAQTTMDPFGGNNYGPAPGAMSAHVGTGGATAPVATFLG